MGFIEYPPLVFRMAWVLLTEVIPNDLAGPLLIRIAELPSEFSGFICSHDTECKRRADHAEAARCIRWSVLGGVVGEA
ncbi:hypothetical protein [Arthrobacter pityocampae]|uniref:hypothetical protein n=1 Tax=Arthrobacter pityocampae TaxID=547334 RepID=UPI0037358DEB